MAHKGNGMGYYCNMQDSSRTKSYIDGGWIKHRVTSCQAGTSGQSTTRRTTTKSYKNLGSTRGPAIGYCTVLCQNQWYHIVPLSLEKIWHAIICFDFLRPCVPLSQSFSARTFATRTEDVKHGWHCMWATCACPAAKIWNTEILVHPPPQGHFQHSFPHCSLFISLVWVLAFNPSNGTVQATFFAWGSCSRRATATRCWHSSKNRFKVPKTSVTFPEVHPFPRKKNWKPIKSSNLFILCVSACLLMLLALDLSHPTTPEVTPPNGTPVKKSHPTITGSHPKQVGPPWYTSFICPWNMVSWTREFWVYLWEVWWIVAKMECTFYANPNGTLANPYLWFVHTFDTSKPLFLWGMLYGECFPGTLKWAIK